MEPVVETTCGTLLRELQHIWDEVGESDEERDRLLLQLEQECLEVYRRKVDQANHGRARLHRAIADAEAELASLVSVLGEIPIVIENQGTLKEQFAAIYPLLEETRQKKEERMQQLADIRLQINRICSEIAESSYCEPNLAAESDLSIRKLEEYQAQLHALQKEKSDRLNTVMDYADIIYKLCSVLSIDFAKIVSEVHPSLKDVHGTQSRSISNETLAKLAESIQQLQQEKKERMLKLQDLGTSLIELWNLMDTPSDEQDAFQHVTRQLAATDDEVTAPGALSADILEQAEMEVERLSQLKISKMKELVFKKRVELENICRRAHMDCDASVSEEKLTALIESGVVDPSDILSNMEEQIGKAKEEAFNRKEILERVEKWMAACEEECWLEDYNKDENRYSASRGAHLNLKRAERARATVNKLPALVESLRAKARAWDEERGTPFLYDGVSLLSMLEEYNFLRQEKEEEKRRMRDHKKIQEQLITEQEVLFGSRPSPNKAATVKKSNGVSRTNGTPASRRLSLGGATMPPGTPETLLAPRVNGVTPSRLGAAAKENKKDRQRTQACLPKEDSGYVLPQVLDRNLGARKPLTPVPVVPVKNLMPMTPVQAVMTKEEEQHSTFSETPQLPTSGTEVGSALPPQGPHHPLMPAAKEEMEYSFEERRLRNMSCYYITASS